MRLNVGVCYTKNTEHGTLVCNSFLQGVAACGDTATKIHVSNAKDADKCDVIVTCCIYNRLGRDGRYARFRKRIELLPVPKLCMDVGFVRNPREVAMQDAYMAVGIGGIKRGAVYANANSPPDRWNALQIPLQPWRRKGRHVLLLGQVENGSSTQHLNGGSEWMQRVLRELPQYTQRPIVVRTHPNDKDIRLPQYVQVTPPGESLSKSLENAWCAVTLTSNAAVWAIINGIPVIAMDPLSMAWPLAFHQLSAIEEDLKTHPFAAHPHGESSYSREQWAYDLAYAQWTPAELRKGLAWQHFRKRLISVLSSPE